MMLRSGEQPMRGCPEAIHLIICSPVKVTRQPVSSPWCNTTPFSNPRSQPCEFRFHASLLCRLSHKPKSRKQRLEDPCSVIALILA